MKRANVILVGGGLQSGLLAAAISHHSPERSVLIIEKAERIGGNHTWSFHPGDVPDHARAWIDKLVSYRWQGYAVRLRGFERQLDLPYASITSDDFADYIPTLPNVTVVTSTDVTRVGDRSVETADGQRLDADLVIDNRGPRACTTNSDPANEKLANENGDQVGYQKFFGFEIETELPWPIDGPIIMDDDVDQQDGFRFVYSLPFTSHRILVEDTRFSDSPDLDRDESLTTTRDYLRFLGVDSFRIVREESGVLPMPFGAIDLPRSSDPLAGGYAGGWFHAATGYSFPLAVAFASSIAQVETASAPAAIAELAHRHRHQARFARFLNRLLFRLVAPKKRYQIFRRFYRVLSESQIARFYSHRFTAADAARIVIGVPPGGLQPIRFLNSFRRSRSSALPAAIPTTTELVSSQRSFEGAP